MTTETSETARPPTIYDVARAAGVSIASVSRVLNGRRNPRAETRDQVLQAVQELGFVPDGAARALSARLKEVVGVVVRRPQQSAAGGIFADEDESLQFPDMINRGMERVAQRYGYDLLIRSVDLHESDGRRIFALARKSDGLILHDQVLDADQLRRLSLQVPVVTLAAAPSPTTVNVRSDNEAGMRELVRHLAGDHGYRSIGYLSGHPDSPDNVARSAAIMAQAAACGAEFRRGRNWQGDYSAAGGARVIEDLLAAGTRLPRAIICGNDQTAIGVLHVLAQRGIAVPDQVAVCGFDDIPVARHLTPRLTSVRQPIQDLGATAFETVHAMISPASGHPEPRGRDIVLPTTVNRRESCGCGAAAAAGTAAAPGRGRNGGGGTAVMKMILRKLAFYALTAIAAVSVDFFIPHAMPGNPVAAVLARMQGNVTQATIRSLELAYGIDSHQSLPAQYLHFWTRLLHGNLGISTSSYPATVTSVISSALPWTLGLVGVATLISFILGTLLGVLIAWRRGTWLDSLLPATTFFQAAPYFFVAFLALQLFSTSLGWLPSVGAYTQGTDFPGWNLTYMTDVLQHAILPALTIVVCSAAGWIVGMRNVMLTTMDEDYVLIAQAKGLPRSRVIWYAARNAILPSVSGFSLAVGFVVSGALLTEIVFSYPGLGFILLQAVGNRDYPLLQGIFLIITFAVLAANLLADFVYIFLDPRIRQEA